MYGVYQFTEVLLANINCDAPPGDSDVDRPPRAASKNYVAGSINQYVLFFSDADHDHDRTVTSPDTQRESRQLHI